VNGLTLCLLFWVGSESRHDMDKTWGARHRDYEKVALISEGLAQILT